MEACENVRDSWSEIRETTTGKIRQQPVSINTDLILSLLVSRLRDAWAIMTCQLNIRKLIFADFLSDKITCKCNRHGRTNYKDTEPYMSAFL